jgi:hypothetical protein
MNFASMSWLYMELMHAYTSLYKIVVVRAVLCSFNLWLYMELMQPNS